MGVTGKRVKFGQLLPIPVAPVDALIRIGVRTEKAGFDSVWAADHLLMMPTGVVPNVWPILTAIASQTEKVELGTCVSDPHRIHPAVFAQLTATVDQISRGRLIIGLGAGEAMNLDQFGIRWDKPLSRLVEFTKIVRGLWLRDEVSYQGKFWSLNRAFLQVRPKRSPVPIYFAANSPRSRELAAKYADGWLPVSLGPRTYRRHLEEVKRAAEATGRPLDGFEPGLFVHAAVADSYEEALNQVRRAKAQIAFAPRLVREAGFELELPKGLPEGLYAGVTLTEEGLKLFEEFGKHVPDEVAVEFSIVGTPEDCARKVEEFVRAGVRHFVLVNLGPDPKFVLDVFARKIIPSYRS